MKSLTIVFLLTFPGLSLADRIVPSAARAAGRNNSFFQTDVRLLNTSATDATMVTLVYYPAGGSPMTSSEMRLDPRRQIAFNNVVETLFGITTDSQGPIRVLAPDFVEVSTRTYNTKDPCTGGTLGSWIPGILAGNATRNGILPHASGSADSTMGYRTNFIAANPSSSSPANVTVVLRGGEGAMLGSASTVSVPPNGVINRDVFLLSGSAAATTDNAFIEFSSDQPVLAISSVVDNRTNDSSEEHEHWRRSRIRSRVLALDAVGECGETPHQENLP